jgi:hypothetical protein
MIIKRVEEKSAAKEGDIVWNVETVPDPEGIPFKVLLGKHGEVARLNSACQKMYAADTSGDRQEEVKEASARKIIADPCEQVKLDLRPQTPV